MLVVRASVRFVIGYVLTFFTLSSMLQSLLILIFYLLTVHPLQHKLGKRIVHTKYGKMRGIYIVPKDHRLQPVEGFLGVPYARPPVGELRFNPPVTPLAWEDVKICNETPPVCPQVRPEVNKDIIPLERIKFIKKLTSYLKKQREDCLYMNIYLPYIGKFLITHIILKTGCL